MNFKDWFCLKDRESFTIDPKINTADARFYFGRAQLDQTAHENRSSSGRSSIPRFPK